MKFIHSFPKILLGIFTSLLTIPVGHLSATEGPHDYFNSLVARPDCWKQYSLRDPAQLNLTQKDPKAVKPYMFYDPSNDKDPHAQDATKVVVPAFSPANRTESILKLAGDIDATSTAIKLEGKSTLYYLKGRTYLIDSEKVVGVDPDDDGPLKVYDASTHILHVSRAQHGSKAESHKAGTLLRVSTNTVPNHATLPLGTEDGNTYLFTWEGYWTDSYLKSGLKNHKTYNFISNGIWLEPNTIFSGGSEKDSFSQEDSIAMFGTRSYNRPGGKEKWDGSSAQGDLGPGVTGGEPLRPQLAQFVFKPNRWVRFWYRIEQRKDDYDYLDVWIADEQNEPVQVYKHLPISVRSKGKNGPLNSIESFYLEYNTSHDLYVRGNDRDFVAYVRNFVALKNPPEDITPLLVRPLAKAGEVKAAEAKPAEVKDAETKSPEVATSAPKDKE